MGVEGAIALVTEANGGIGKSTLRHYNQPEPPESMQVRATLIHSQKLHLLIPIGSFRFSLILWTANLFKLLPQDART